MSGTRLAIVILAVADIPRALGFYRSVFGWTLEVETPVYVEFSLPDDMRLGLYQRDAFARNVNEAIHAIPAEALAPTELYLFPDDLEATAVRLHVAGARSLSSLAPRDWGRRGRLFRRPRRRHPGTGSTGACVKQQSKLRNVQGKSGPVPALARPGRVNQGRAQTQPQSAQRQVPPTRKGPAYVRFFVCCDDDEGALFSPRVSGWRRGRRGAGPSHS